MISKGWNPIFYIKKENELIADTLADDQAVILDTNKGLTVLLGCSHRGVINTLNHVVRLTGKKTIHAILGGLHLGKASDSKVKQNNGSPARVWIGEDRGRALHRNPCICGTIQ